MEMPDAAAPRRTSSLHFDASTSSFLCREIRLQHHTIHPCTYLFVAVTSTYAASSPSSSTLTASSPRIGGFKSFQLPKQALSYHEPYVSASSVLHPCSTPAQKNMTKYHSPIWQQRNWQRVVEPCQRTNLALPVEPELARSRNESVITRSKQHQRRAITRSPPPPCLVNQLPQLAKISYIPANCNPAGAQDATVGSAAATLTATASNRSRRGPLLRGSTSLWE
jgi:hypothetical protein